MPNVRGLRASLYLVVFVITRTGSATNRIHEYFHPESEVYELQMFHILCSGLQGFLYALVYINNERVFSRLQEACRCGVIHGKPGRISFSKHGAAGEPPVFRGRRDERRATPSMLTPAYGLLAAH